MSTEGTSATSFTSITTYLSWDHERLDRALAVASEDVEAGRMAEARGAFAEYDRGLGRHMRIEEELLYAAESYTWWPDCGDGKYCRCASA